MRGVHARLVHLLRVRPVQPEHSAGQRCLAASSCPCRPARSGMTQFDWRGHRRGARPATQGRGRDDGLSRRDGPDRSAQEPERSPYRGIWPVPLRPPPILPGRTGAVANSSPAQASTAGLSPILPSAPAPILPRRADQPGAPRLRSCRGVYPQVRARPVRQFGPKMSLAAIVSRSRELLSS